MQTAGSILATRDPRLLTLAASASLALAVVVLSLLGSPATAAILPLAVGVGAAVLWQPFLGTFLIVLLSQQGAITETIVRGFSGSYIDVLAGLTLGGIALVACRDPRAARFAPDSVGFRFAVLFLIAALLSSLFAQKDLALQGLIQHGGGVLLVYLILATCRTLRQAELLLLALLASTAVSAAIGVSDYFLGSSLGRFGSGYVRGGEGIDFSVIQSAADANATLRRVGTANRSATASSHMLAVGTILAIGFLVRTSWMRMLALATAVLGFGGTIVTFARSGALTVAIGGVWILAELFRRGRFRVAVPLLMAIVAGTVVLTPGYFWERVTSLTEKPAEDNTFQQRVGMLQTGFALIVEEPLLGIGPDNFLSRSNAFEFRHRRPGSRGRPLHNMYLSVAVEEGLLGFACYAGMLLACLTVLARAIRTTTNPHGRVLAQALLVAFTCYLVACNTQHSEKYKFTWMMVGLALAVGRVVARTGPEQPALSPTTAP